MNVPLQYYPTSAPTVPSAKTLATDFVQRDRVRNDAKLLTIKYIVLSETLADAEKVACINPVESGLLYEQRQAMKMYLEALNARIQLWEGE